MKAARIHAYGPPDVLRIEDIERPSPGPRDVLVQVRAAAVNPVDWKIRSGSQRAVVRHRLPHVLGLDVSGVVVERGAEVSEFEVGDEVFSSPDHRRQGTYAEYVAIDAGEVARKPANVSHEQAASIPLVGLTAWQCLVTAARVGADERVIVEAGAGGVGSFAIQLAKHLGAHVATTCSERNADFVRELGADVVIDYTRQQLERELSDYDVALDALGGAQRARLRAALRRGGRLATINSGLPAAVRRYGAYLGVAVAGAKLAWFSAWSRLVYGVRTHIVVRKPSGEQLARIAALVESGAIRPVVGEVYPLARIADAHRASETGRARGKIVVAVS